MLGVRQEKTLLFGMGKRIMMSVNSSAWTHAIVAWLDDFQKVVIVRHVAGVQQDGTKKWKREIQIWMELNIEI